MCMLLNFEEYFRELLAKFGELLGILVGNSRKNYWELLGNYWPTPKHRSTTKWS